MPSAFCIHHSAFEKALTLTLPRSTGRGNQKSAGTLCAEVSKSDMPMTDANDEHRIPIHLRWNDTQSPCDSHRCIHWLFETQAECAPDAIAVDDGRCIRTYAELNERANQLAHHLNSLGVGRGNRVALCMERSPDLIVALLGILKSGAAYVPLDASWPEHRIDCLANELRCDAIVIDPPQFERSARFADLNPRTMKIVCADNGNLARESLSIGNPLRKSSPDDLAYVIFTSGSTGSPKAVAVRHRRVINLIDWVNKTFNICRCDRILFATSVAFDLSVYDVFGILAAGGTIRIANDDDIRDPGRMAEILHHGNITFWNSAPAAFERLLPSLKAAKGSSRLRLIFLSGDWVPLSLVPRIQELFHGARLIVLGGATEATVWSNFYVVSEIDPTWKSIPYGRPIQNVHYYIFNAELRSCAVGMDGDLYIAGECLADGYLNDAELTARKFISNPLVPDERIYATGDRARYFPDGNIEFLGRADRQVKIRGYRVEPAEIEAALQRHPVVLRAVVLAEAETHARTSLMAYVVVRQFTTQHAIGPELRSALLRQMPDYMVPARISILPHFPLSANGKIDVSALRSLPPPATDYAELREMPQTRIQRRLAAIWCRILRRETVGIDENFFDLGGDSLQTVEFIAAAAAFGVTLRLEDLRAHPTIRKLAAIPANAPQPAATNHTADEIPLTPIQHWFFDRSLKFPGRYNCVFAFEALELPEIGRLRQAVQYLQQHHLALRLRFKQIQQRWVQSIAEPSVASEVVVWNLSSLRAAGQPKEILRRLSLLRREMDLQRGPLFQVILINANGRRAQLLLLCHHLVIDAASVRVLVEDLNALLAQLDRREPLHLPKSSSFADWANRLAEFAGSTAASSEANYWLGLPWNELAPLPRDFREGINNYGASRTLIVELPGHETAALQVDLPKHLGVSVGEILLAAYLQTLSIWAGRPTVLVDLTVHGRHPFLSDISLSRTVGYITANVPVVIAVADGASIAEVAEAVQSHLRQMPRWGVGFGMLRYLSPQSHITTALRRFPRPEIKFNYLGAMATGAALSERFRPSPAPYCASSPGVLDPSEKRAYLHNVELSIVSGKLRIEWKFSESFHRAQTIKRLLRSFTSLLRAAIHNVAADVESTVMSGASGGMP
jgi:amino acid adenylation domain-containing protein/non-ribosomal peptide synthase protein (TIGR01720 family)